MAEPDKISETKSKVQEESSLKGTFISVLMLGGFIIVTWFGVWMLFISR